MIYSAECQAFFNRLITPPTAARAAIYASLIDGLVKGGVWTNVLDGLFLYAADQSGTGIVNILVNDDIDSTVNTTGNIAPIFTQNVGWTSIQGALPNPVLNTTYNLATSGGHYKQNDAMVGGWLIGNNQENEDLVDSSDVLNGGFSGYIRLSQLWSNGNTIWNINSSASATNNDAVTSRSDGFWQMQRTGVNSSAIYRNTVLLSTSTNTSVIPTNEVIIGTTITNTIACIVFGRSLTTDQNHTLYIGLQTYLQSVGAI